MCILQKKFLINGKFLSVNIKTGVHRVADEFVHALDRILSNEENSNISFEIVVPKNFQAELKLDNISVYHKGFLSGYFKNIPWEHLNLPMIASGKYLISLCNVAPFFYRQSIVVIHDAQVYLTPKSYSLAFRLWYRCLIPLITSRCKAVITVSNFSKSQLVSHGIVNPKKVLVIPNGCDHMLRISPNDSILTSLGLDNTVYFIAQANLQAHKNISVLLRAFSDSKLQKVKLVLYGNKNKTDFERAGFMVPNNVIFSGRVTDEELKALLQNAFATLTPSLTEGFGLQPLEGMALGVPAVISQCGALPEVGGELAIIADADSSDEWVEAIVKLSNSPATNEFKEQLKIHASKYTWDKSASMLISFLNQF